MRNLSGVSRQSFSFFLYHGSLYIPSNFLAFFRVNMFLLFPFFSTVAIRCDFVQSRMQAGLFSAQPKEKCLLTFFKQDPHGTMATQELKFFPLPLFGLSLFQIFVAASHQTRLDTRSKARRPIKVGIKGRGRSGTSRDSNPACLCCSSAHLVQCEPDEASSFTNPNVGPGTYASLRLKLDAWSSAVQGGQRRQKCSSPTRR